RFTSTTSPAENACKCANVTVRLPLERPKEPAIAPLAFPNTRKLARVMLAGATGRSNVIDTGAETGAATLRAGLTARIWRSAARAAAQNEQRLEVESAKSVLRFTNITCPPFRGGDRERA